MLLLMIYLADVELQSVLVSGIMSVSSCTIY